MKYILINKSWKTDKKIEAWMLKKNMRRVNDILYEVNGLKFVIHICLQNETIYEIVPLRMRFAYSQTVDTLNGEILNKIVFYLAINKNSNLYLMKGSTPTNFNDIYQLKLKNIQLNSSEATLLKMYIHGFNYKTDTAFRFDDLWKNCYLSYDKNKMLQPVNTNIKLYKYQANTVYWMQEIENNKIDFTMNTSVDISDMIDDKSNIYFNPINMKLSKTKQLQKFSYKGAILGDEMGSGKTICCASIIVNNPSKVKVFTKIDKKIYTKATLVVVPGHLAKQWEFELKKFNKKLKVILYLSRVHHKKYTIKDILNADVLIVTTQFLTNKDWYLRIMRDLHIRYAEDKWKSKPADILIKYIYSSLNESNDNLNVNEKSETTSEYSMYGILNKSKDLLLEIKNPILNIFHFHRIIADEAHQILSSSGSRSVNDDNYYLKNILLSLEADHYWYVSGTPFIENNSLYTICEFLRLGINNYKNLGTELMSANINRDDIYKHLLKTLYIRHTKDSIKDEINIPPVLEENIFLEFTDIEKALYEKSDSKSIIARQMCCHPSINDHDRQAFLDSDNIPNLLETKEKIIKSRENELNSLEDRLIKIIASNDKIVNQNEYSKEMFLKRKKELKDKIHSIKYILKIFRGINVEKNEKEEEEMCPILLEPIVDGVITKCGHKFSKEGLLDGLKATRKKECPLCRTPLKSNEIYEMTPNTDEKEVKKIDEYTYKYGTKMGKLIRMIIEIKENKNNRIIIFSQWDSLLKLISNTLTEIKISNVRCKGNTYQRNAAIMKFKKGLNSKKKNKTGIILLSLENAAAGTNLTEATHIFLVDPIKGSKEHVKATEDQAIGRAHRIGQENQVKIYRLIIKNTIEEQIFNECYKNTPEELSTELVESILAV